MRLESRDQTSLTANNELLFQSVYTLFNLTQQRINFEGYVLGLINDEFRLVFVLFAASGDMSSRVAILDQGSPALTATGEAKA